jgi:alpha-amylase
LKITLDGAPMTGPAPAARPGSGFGDNPIVYFLLIDRFASDCAAPLDQPGGFHGGKLQGITAKIREGWFAALGVNALWLSAPFEQIPGWVPGGHNEFRHYPYHGYFTHDYTVLDRRFGSDDDLRELVDTAHAHRLRVILDVAINHPGYLDHDTLARHMPAALGQGWQDANPGDWASYIDFHSMALVDWWGPDWVRAGLPGYSAGGADELTRQIAGLPDFRTENPAPVRLPVFLRQKSPTRAVDLPDATVRDYLTEWLVRWVREFGIDGFRCDSAKHVDLETWALLKHKAAAALADWKARNPARKMDDDPFWMTGEVFGQWIERNDYFDQGFDNLINFGFQHEVDEFDLDSLFRRYAARLAGRPQHNVLSYVSSHDTCLFDRDRLIHAGTALLLAPGGVQIFYGDETARPAGPVPAGDPIQATRSAMNWATPDLAVLTHWRRLGQFRNRHVALARGTHLTLQHHPLIFSREDHSTHDVVIVGIGIWGEHVVEVAGLLEDGEPLIDAYSARALQATGGTLRIDGCGTVLIERASAYRPFYCPGAV